MKYQDLLTGPELKNVPVSALYLLDLDFKLATLFLELLAKFSFFSLCGDVCDGCFAHLANSQQQDSSCLGSLRVTILKTVILQDLLAVA